MMDIQTAQHDVQTTFLRGSVGQTVSGLLWLASATVGVLVGEVQAILTLMIGGVLIFPLTVLGLRLLGKPGGLPRTHPMNGLAMQTAFIVPLLIPVIYAAALYEVNWFYPAFMMVVGAHYLPFVFLYGMWEFAVLGAALLGGGLAIGLYFNQTFTLGGWVTGALLLLFALIVQFTPRLRRQ